ncbi:MAG: helix-turn-helix transcriptional regulator [Lachnospiraceae bacterium]|nr:helix-turn-helix transcriptional regulator [Lachnospiraceae bacterium]
MNTVFSQNLKTAREIAGLSQKDVSARVGVAKSTYSLYESGKREPNISTICKIAKVLKISGNELLGTGSSPPYNDLLTKIKKLDNEDRAVVEATINGLLLRDKYNDK